MTLSFLCTPTLCSLHLIGPQPYDFSILMNPKRKIPFVLNTEPYGPFI